ncbi:MAG: M28 family metallopeptidase [Erysipelotrichaceae bacterium]|nr:M28 family metallopeptidase [Erysipelotrichaceae bacterium]
MNGTRAYELLNQMGFVRVGGSKEERTAAQILMDEIHQLNQPCTLEEFEVNAQTIEHVCFETITPIQKQYEVTAYGYSGNTPEGGIEAEFYYMETIGEVDKIQAKGKIVLVNGYLGRKTYEAIVEAGAVGFITFSGDVIDTRENSDCDIRELRDQLQEIKVLPGVHMRTIDAMELVRSNPKTVRITLTQTQTKSLSHNVIAEIKGTKHPEKVIIFTAHYDSVPFSTGVYDNGAGSVTIMECYRYFLEHAPERTLRFIWCGSEERGLLGSKAYVKAHMEELKDVQFVINVDVGGCVLGHDVALVTAADSLVHTIDSFAKQKGYSLEVKQDIYSSDHIPFVDQGIPAVSFCRFGTGQSAHIHNRHDTMLFISADALEKTGTVVLEFAKTISNAVAFPFKREIPNDIKEKIDVYLGKTK